jgi:hypothetical protein
VTTGALTSPAAFPTNHINTHGRGGGENKPSAGKFYNHRHSGKLRCYKRLLPTILVKSTVVQQMCDAMEENKDTASTSEHQEYSR